MEYISKEKVIELLYKFHVDKACEDCVDAIECLPSENVVGRSDKTGKWIEIKSTEYKEFSVTDMKCNCCNRYASLVLPHGTACTYDFCPNCGAYMKGTNNEM